MLLIKADYSYYTLDDGSGSYFKGLCCKDYGFYIGFYYVAFTSFFDKGAFLCSNIFTFLDFTSFGLTDTIFNFTICLLIFCCYVSFFELLEIFVACIDLFD